MRVFGPVKAPSFSPNIIALYLALLVYGFLGSPTPNSPGLVEISVAVLLIVAVGMPGFISALYPYSYRYIWQTVGLVFLTFGLSVPLLIGVFYANPVMGIVRDIIPFGFLVLPLFLFHLFEGEDAERNTKGFIIAVCVLAMLFTWRHLNDVYTILLVIKGGWGSRFQELTYLANAPTILFTALFFWLSVLRIMAGALSVRKALYILLLIIGVWAVILTYITTLQRASLGYLCVFMVISTAVYFMKAPLRVGAMILVLSSLLLLSFSGSLIHAYENLLQKTYLVGQNSRVEELMAVWGAISDSSMTILFGKGWGANFESPAVAYVRVNFTHSFLSALLLKAGLFGAAIGLFYVVSLMVHFFRTKRRNYLLYLCLFGPVFIDTFFYAAYKSLDFGIVLLLLVVIYNDVDDLSEKENRV